MKTEYKVYRKSSADTIPVVSPIPLLPFQMIGKKKYTGKKAKIETIFRLTGVSVPLEYTTQQVNQYLASHLFNTSLWAKYRDTLAEVMSETEVITISYTQQYTLIAELDDNLVNDAFDERVIHHITCELMGKAKDIYKGLKNPIIALEKNFNQ